VPRLCLLPANPESDVVALLGLAEVLPISLPRSAVLKSGVLKGPLSGDNSGCLWTDAAGGGSGPPSSMEEIDMLGLCGVGSSRIPEP
jgi:hypothetical protein